MQTLKRIINKMCLHICGQPDMLRYSRSLALRELLAKVAR